MQTAMLQMAEESVRSVAREVWKLGAKLTVPQASMVAKRLRAIDEMLDGAEDSVANKNHLREHVRYLRAQILRVVA